MGLYVVQLYSIYHYIVWTFSGMCHDSLWSQITPVLKTESITLTAFELCLIIEFYVTSTLPNGETMCDFKYSHLDTFEPMNT